jgi:hypothetical protein
MGKKKQNNKGSKMDPKLWAMGLTVAASSEPMVNTTPVRRESNATKKFFADVMRVHDEGVRLADEARRAAHKASHKMSTKVWSSPPGDGMTCGNFGRVLTKYYLSLTRRMDDQEKYVRSTVDNHIAALNTSMNSYTSSEIEILMCQSISTKQATSVCERYSVNEFDLAITEGRITLEEAIGILGFHPDKDGVRRFKDHRGLHLSFEDYESIYTRASASKALTRAQLDHVRGQMGRKIMMENGFYGASLFCYRDK